ncbi:MAG: tRNA (adenosine(37)-N6)-threonylcarbamoyltransferase complex dimerization subunit type 1 TsaB [Bacteroidales bacterium]
MPFIDSLFSESGIRPEDLNAVAVSKGPGSYTGLRIGVSTAKGICYATGAHLISIGTLDAMARGMLERIRTGPFEAFMVPMIDARRMEVYSAVYNHHMERVREVQADIVEKDTYLKWLNTGHKVVFFGNGAPKTKPVIAHANAIFIDNFVPSASYLIPEALEKFEKGDFEDTAYFEPYYLKDFVAGIPKVKGLH